MQQCEVIEPSIIIAVSKLSRASWAIVNCKLVVMVGEEYENDDAAALGHRTA